ncbi:MAG: hypothetical protein J1E40_10065, partial [Oscillospiraceae bacterium]|nr:hypothetical protein [Oscillospiraceae bacterium]
MKRILKFISLMAAMSVLILSSCTTEEVQNESDPGDMVTESISEEVSSSASEKIAEETTVTTADASETKAVVI